MFLGVRGRWEVVLVGEVRPRVAAYETQARRWAQNCANEHGQALLLKPDGTQELFVCQLANKQEQDSMDPCVA